jgi:hypothetical protein
MSGHQTSPDIEDPSHYVTTAPVQEIGRKVRGPSQAGTVPGKKPGGQTLLGFQAVDGAEFVAGRAVLGLVGNLSHICKMIFGAHGNHAVEDLRER